MRPSAVVGAFRVANVAWDSDDRRVLLWSWEMGVFGSLFGRARRKFIKRKDSDAGEAGMITVVCVLVGTGCSWVSLKLVPLIVFLVFRIGSETSKSFGNSEIIEKAAMLLCFF